MNPEAQTIVELEDFEQARCTHTLLHHFADFQTVYPTSQRLLISVWLTTWANIKHQSDKGYLQTFHVWYQHCESLREG